MIEWICGTIIVLFTFPVILSGILSSLMDGGTNANNNKRQKNNNRRWDWGS